MQTEAQEVAEIACCEPTHKGPWRGEWEPCLVLARHDDGVYVQCVSDNLKCTVQKKYIRPLRHWRCKICTFTNGTERHCQMCRNGVRPGVNPVTNPVTMELDGNASGTPDTNFKRQRNSEPQLSDLPLQNKRQKQQIKQQITSFKIHEVAACEADHKGEWHGLWESCKVLTQDQSTCDVQILSDGAICKNVSNSFVRQKCCLELVCRKWC